MRQQKCICSRWGELTAFPQVPQLDLRTERRVEGRRVKGLGFSSPVRCSGVIGRRKLKFLQRYARSDSIVCLACNEYFG